MDTSLSAQPRRSTSERFPIPNSRLAEPPIRSTTSRSRVTTLVLGFTSAPGNAASDWTLHISNVKTVCSQRRKPCGHGHGIRMGELRAVLEYCAGTFPSGSRRRRRSPTTRRCSPAGRSRGAWRRTRVPARTWAARWRPRTTDTGDTLTYSLEGADGGSFTIVGASGQIQTKAALNYEAKSSYSVTVKVNDGTVDATKAVTISVTDVDEPPDQPAAPTVSAKSGADRQPGRELDGARQYRPAHHGLRRAVPDRDHRVVHQPPLQRDGQVHHHRGTHRRHRIRGAGAGRATSRARAPGRPPGPPAPTPPRPPYPPTPRCRR